MVLVAAVGCGGAQPEAAVQPEVTVHPDASVQSEASVQPEATVQPEPTAQPAIAADAEIADLVEGNSAFAFDLYRALGAEDGDLFYSPYSISLALAMAYAGARGETERQMAETLHYLLSQERLHDAFNVLGRELVSRGEAQRERGEGFRLNIANAVWGQEDYVFLEGFLDVLAASYGSRVRPANLQEAPEESRSVINRWVADQTEDRITDLIPPGAINEGTRMVLTNAVYFNAEWATPFEEAATSMRPFHLLSGGEVGVPMMERTGYYGYGKGDGYQAVDLAYGGGELSMTILLPDTGRFREFEASLDAALVGRILEAIKLENIELGIPKFEFESQFGLAETLAAMGMPDAFDQRADLSGMDGRSCSVGDFPCLFISKILHKAFVSVDEEGTEAAAATAVVATVSSAPPPPEIRVVVNRPFVFLIRDRETGAIIFVGRIENPA